MAFRKPTETGSGVLALVNVICTNCFLQVGVNTFTNTNLEMSVRIKRESVLFVCTCVAQKRFVYVIAAGARRDDKQVI